MPKTQAATFTCAKCGASISMLWMVANVGYCAECAASWGQELEVSRLQAEAALLRAENEKLRAFVADQPCRCGDFNYVMYGKTCDRCKLLGRE